MAQDDQNNWLQQLVTALKSSRTLPDQVDLPIFRPETNDASKWLSHVEDIRREFGWSDTQVLVRAGRFLTGSAKRWFERWSPETRNLFTFKCDFLEAFPPKRNLGQLFTNAASFNSSRVNTYETYVHEKISLLRNLRVEWREIDLLEIVIHGIEERDVQTAASNRGCKTISELLTFLSKFTKRGSTSTSPVNSHNLQIDASRTPKRCFNCGQLGHVQANCRGGPPYQNPRSSEEHAKNRERKNRRKPEVDNVCSFCLRPGHDIESCFVKNGIDKRRRVQLCTSAIDTTPHIKVIVGDKHLLGLLDTGSDVSLIADKYQADFEPFESCLITLTGIGASQITVTQMFETEVTISEVKTFLKLLLVPSKILDCDILIGRDIFNDQAISAVIGQQSTQIRRHITSEVKIIHSQSTFLDKSFISLIVENKYRVPLLEVLNDFPELVKPTDELGCIKNCELEIKLSQNKVISHNPYRLSMSERSQVKEIIDNLLNRGIIRESNSPYSSPILLVKKKEGDYRLCVDYRALNVITIKDRFPLPLIEDQLDRLGNSKYFTSLDMKAGYHQIPVAQNSIGYTAFVTPDGQFEYLRMPFGLANGPAIFQRAINHALGSLRYNKALVYLDDILIPSMTPEDGLQFLKEVLQALSAAGFTLNLKKCRFLQTSLEYLGRVISADGVRPSPGKIQALLDAPVPTTPKQVRQLMGLAGYFRKFIPHFASRTACITKLTKQGEPFVWSVAQQEAQKYIIQCLTSEPLLQIFDPLLPTELHTDASNVGYGGILMQKCNDQLRVVAYYSKRTNEHEARYHSYELETLAIVNSVKHFRVYLLGITFNIVTDCNAVKSTFSKKDLIPRVVRWWAYLQDFDFRLIYRKGSSLQHVDYLSRNPIMVRQVQEHNWLRVEQKQNSEVEQLLSKLREGNLDPNQYVEKDGLLMHKHLDKDGNVALRFFVPRYSRLGLLRIYHDEQCHIGADITFESVARHFWFPKMRTIMNMLRIESTVKSEWPKQWSLAADLPELLAYLEEAGDTCC